MLVLLGVAGATSGCIAEWVGAVGLTRDESGALVAIAVTCGHDLSSARLDGSTEDGSWEQVAVWEHDDGLDGVVTWRLDDPEPGDGWTVVDDWDGVEDDRTYELRGLAGGLFGGTYIGPLIFTGSDLEHLAERHILQGGGDQSIGQDVLRLQTIKEFSRTACE